MTAVALRYFYIGAWICCVVMFSGVMVDITFQSNYAGPIHWMWFMYAIAMMNMFKKIAEDWRFIKENTGA